MKAHIVVTILISTYSKFILADYVNTPKRFNTVPAFRIPQNLYKGFASLFTLSFLQYLEDANAVVVNPSKTQQSLNSDVVGIICPGYLLPFIGLYQMAEYIEESYYSGK